MKFYRSDLCDGNSDYPFVINCEDVAVLVSGTKPIAALVDEDLTGSMDPHDMTVSQFLELTGRDGGMFQWSEKHGPLFQYGGDGYNPDWEDDDSVLVMVPRRFICYQSFGWFRIYESSHLNHRFWRMKRETTLWLIDGEEDQLDTPVEVHKLQWHHRGVLIERSYTGGPAVELLIDLAACRRTGHEEVSVC